MDGIEMVRRNLQICIRDYVAAIRERDPQQCWIFQPSVDYNDFNHLQESTCESITGSKGESSGKRKRKGVESNNPAGNDENVYNYLAMDYEEDSDDVTLGEFLRKQRTLKVNKNKKKQKALQVKEARLSMAKPSHAGSCGRLGGLKSPGSASGVREPVVGLGGAKKKQKTLQVEKATGSYGGLGGLKTPGSVSGVHEPVVGVGGDKKKQKALEVENSRLFVAKPAVGSSSGLKPPGSVSRVHEPVVGVGGDKKKQNALQVEKARLFVAKHVGSSGGLVGLRPPGSVVGVGGARSWGGLGGLNPPGSVCGVYEPVVGVGGAKKKQNGLEVAKPSLAGSSGGPGRLSLPGSVSRILGCMSLWWELINVRVWLIHGTVRSWSVRSTRTLLNLARKLLKAL